MRGTTSSTSSRVAWEKLRREDIDAGEDDVSEDLRVRQRRSPSCDDFGASLWFRHGDDDSYLGAAKGMGAAYGYIPCA